jgi:hypothetical protein
MSIAASVVLLGRRGALVFHYNVGRTAGRRKAWRADLLAALRRDT